MSRKLIYFAQCETASNLQAVKIGIAGNPWARVSELQCGSPTLIRIKIVVRGDFDLERSLHETFDDLRLRGEWFVRLAELRDLLDRLEPKASRSGEVSEADFYDALSDVVDADFEAEFA